MTLAPNDFTHLHLHSEFSLLDGLGRIGDLVDEAERLGFDSLAITDHGALYGAVAFYQAGRAKGIKPIIGVETYVARRSMRDKEGKADAQPYHLTLLAKDLVGYRNLCRLLTDAHVDGYYYKPRIDREHLARYAEGLVGMSACLGGEIPKALEVDDWELARHLAGEYRDILGKDGFYLELMDHGLAEQTAMNPKLLRLAGETGLPLVVTNDLHYVHKSQAEAHDVLLCVGTGSNLDTPNRLRFETPEFYLKSAAEMFALFPDQREAYRNTRRIAEMVDLELPARPAPHPALPGPRRRDRRELAAQGVRERPRPPLRGDHARAPGPPRVRARRHHLRWATPATSSSSPTSSASPASRRSRPPAAAAPRARSSPTPWASRRSTPSTTGCRSSGSSTPTG